MCYIARISILTRADDECLIELFFVQGMNFIPLSCGAIKGEEKEESLWRGEKILPERVESRLSEFEMMENGRKFKQTKLYGKSCKISHLF